MSNPEEIVVIQDIKNIEQKMDLAPSSPETELNKRLLADKQKLLASIRRATQSPIAAMFSGVLSIFILVGASMLMHRILNPDINVLVIDQTATEALVSEESAQSVMRSIKFRNMVTGELLDNLNELNQKVIQLKNELANLLLNGLAQDSEQVIAKRAEIATAEQLVSEQQDLIALKERQIQMNVYTFSKHTGRYIATMIVMSFLQITFNIMYTAMKGSGYFRTSFPLFGLDFMMLIMLISITASFNNLFKPIISKDGTELFSQQLQNTNFVPLIKFFVAMWIVYTILSPIRIRTQWALSKVMIK